MIAIGFWESTGPWPISLVAIGVLLWLIGRAWIQKQARRREIEEARFFVRAAGLDVDRHGNVVEPGNDGF
jgi:hypothetical protein